MIGDKYSCKGTATEINIWNIDLGNVSPDIVEQKQKIIGDHKYPTSEIECINLCKFINEWNQKTAGNEQKFIDFCYLMGYGISHKLTKNNHYRVLKNNRVLTNTHMAIAYIYHVKNWQKINLIVKALFQKDKQKYDFRVNLKIDDGFNVHHKSGNRDKSIDDIANNLTVISTDDHKKIHAGD